MVELESELTSRSLQNQCSFPPSYVAFQYDVLSLSLQELVTYCAQIHALSALLLKCVPPVRPLDSSASL